MKITFLGHAGLFVETKCGTVLCDPWFNPAFQNAWYPFPANDSLPTDQISTPDFLFISHPHQDHFDRKFLKEHVSKSAWVILPDFPLPALRDQLVDCGFSRFIETKNGDPVIIDGLRVMVEAVVSPSDGPIGDSSLLLDDGTTTIFNQNDCHFGSLEKLKSMGPLDGHFMQFSGAIWYPAVYNFPPEIKQRLGRAKRLNQLERALLYIDQLDAKHVFPVAGPACFLDDALFELNDLDDDPSNIFYDQMTFLNIMKDSGRVNGQLVIPGSVIELDGGAGSCRIAHALHATQIDSIFIDKRNYLKQYQSRMQPSIKAFHDSLPCGETDIVSSIKAWFEPLLQSADYISREINARVLFDCSPSDGFFIDFKSRKVSRWAGEYCEYRFFVESALIEKCVLERCEDWINELFLSCRFRAERDIGYSEHLYVFFTCLSAERIQYVENYYAARAKDESEFFELDGHLIQRFCPHQKADLKRFGKIADGVLTCQMHGWQFDLKTGKCISASGHYSLLSRPLRDG